MPGESRVTIDDLGFFPAIEASLLSLTAASAVPIYSSWVTNYDPPSPAFLESPARPFAGLHLNLLEGRCDSRRAALCDAGGQFCRRWIDFCLPSRELRLAVAEEIELQCQKILDWFGRIDHCDSHLHLHAHPWIYRLVEQAGRKYDFEHIRNAYEPLTDGPSLHPKLLILKLLNLLHRPKAMPCYGISRGFRNTRAKCVSVLSKADRELVLHTQLGAFQGDLSKFRFLTTTQLALREEEHRQMLAFVSNL